MSEDLFPLQIKDSDTAGQAQYNFPAGFVRTSDEPHQVFYDPFDAALDTTNDWATAAAAGGGVAPAVATGNMSMATGTVAAGWSKLISAPTFRPTIPAWLGFSFAIILPDGAAPIANSYRFWGAGTVPASPTAAAPLTNAVGFEMTTAGHLCAVSYAGGTRTLVTDFFGTTAQPTDALGHRYIVYVRTDRSFWYLDSLATPIASSSFQGPQIQTLPVTYLAVAGTTPASSAQIQSMGLAVWDTGKNASMLADGVRPWRKAQITAAGEQMVRANQNAVVSTANSSTANILGSGGFTGASDSTLNVAAIQVNLTADQSCSVQVQQSIDGTNWDYSDVFTAVANTGDSRTFMATASFCRVLIANQSVLDTTFFRLQTVLLPIGDAVPRSLTSLGSLRTALNEPIPTGTNSIGSVIPTTAAGAVGGRADGWLNVRQDPTSLLLDTFETIDTTNTWTLGGITIPTGANGVLTVSAGTAANGSSWAKSQAAFLNGASAYLQNALIVTLSAAAVTGNTRWWGLGIPQATPTTGVPCTNGVVFEVRAADGLLWGSVYSGTALTASVALTRPTDGAAHRYQIQFRSSRVYFNIDSVEVGSIAFPSPTVAALPATIGSVNGASVVSPAAVLTSTVIGVADTGRNNLAISDAKFPWREGRVTAAGEVLITDTYRLKQSVASLHSGRFTVLAAADTALVGRMWLINPVGSAVLLELRRVEMSTAPTAVTAFPSSPRITVERVTFTGTASGAQITPSVRDSTEAALVGSVRTASTGLTLTAGAAAYGFTVVPILTGVGAAVPVLQEWEPAEAGRLVLRAGQGVVIRQPDAGTASDTRSFAINMAWSEYTVPT